MKSLLILIVSLALTVHASADLNDEISKLSSEKYQLTRQISEVFQANKLNDNSEYKALGKEALQASLAYSKLCKQHPQLKELNAASDAAQQRYVDARMAKDKEASKEAKKEMMQAISAQQAAARKIPEITEAQNKAIAINKQREAMEKTLIATTPEGSELIKKIEALDTKIAELQKEIKASGQ